MYREISFSEKSTELLEQLKRGAFLTVRSGDALNTMTIGWGSIGFIWNKPVFTALVRYSRYTYELIKDAEDFTISLPLGGQLKNELKVCGCESGRDIDKFKEFNIKTRESIKAKTPVIRDCDLFIECRKIYESPMIKEKVAADIDERSYPDGDYHVMYYGEILTSYIKE